MKQNGKHESRPTVTYAGKETYGRKYQLGHSTKWQEIKHEQSRNLRKEM
jgi:hypothetical protein